MKWRKWNIFSCIYWIKSKINKIIGRANQFLKKNILHDGYESFIKETENVIELTPQEVLTKLLNDDMIKYKRIVMKYE